MKPGRSRSKGSGFERDVAKMIIKAFRKFKISGKHCYRTPMSGGHRFASQTDPGDIVMSEQLRQLFPFCIECKFHKWVKLDSWMQKRRKVALDDWLRQVCRSATTQVGMRPLLVFKGNNQPIYCVYGIKLSSVIGRDGVALPCVIVRDPKQHLWGWAIERFDTLLARYASQACKEKE